MVVIADKCALYFLEFEDGDDCTYKIDILEQNTNYVISNGYTKPITSIELELNSYFSGTLKEFKTPLCMIGSPFQKLVWRELQKIPHGETRSYSEIASAIGNNAATRAVGRANGANNFFIIVPCHRVINANGQLGGLCWRG